MERYLNQALGMDLRVLWSIHTFASCLQVTTVPGARFFQVFQPKNQVREEPQFLSVLSVFLLKCLLQWLTFPNWRIRLALLLSAMQSLVVFYLSEELSMLATRTPLCKVSISSASDYRQLVVCLHRLREPRALKVKERNKKAIQSMKLEEWEVRFVGSATRLSC